MVSLNEMIDGAWIEGEQLTKPGSKFVEQLADLMSELHTMWGMDEYMENLLYRKEWILNDMHDVVYALEGARRYTSTGLPVDDFLEKAISDISCFSFIKENVLQSFIIFFLFKFTI